jgi:DNA-binding response OmpR family regulator
MDQTSTILIVDDNPDISHLLTLFLTRAGFKVLEASDGEEGCKLAERMTPSLILCDERMPGMDGYATLRKLKGTTLTAQIPVVMIGGSAPGSQHDWLALGAFSFLPKPFQLPELLAAVEKALSAGLPLRPLMNR